MPRRSKDYGFDDYLDDLESYAKYAANQDGGKSPWKIGAMGEVRSFSLDKKVGVGISHLVGEEGSFQRRKPRLKRQDGGKSGKRESSVLFSYGLTNEDDGDDGDAGAASRGGVRAGTYGRGSNNLDVGKGGPFTQNAKFFMGGMGGSFDDSTGSLGKKTGKEGKKSRKKSRRRGPAGRLNMESGINTSLPSQDDIPPVEDIDSLRKAQFKVDLGARNFDDEEEIHVEAPKDKFSEIFDGPIDDPLAHLGDKGVTTADDLYPDGIKGEDGVYEKKKDSSDEWSQPEDFLRLHRDPSIETAPRMEFKGPEEDLETKISNMLDSYRDYYTRDESWVASEYASIRKRQKIHSINYQTMIPPEFVFLTPYPSYRFYTQMGVKHDQHFFHPAYFTANNKYLQKPVSVIGGVEIFSNDDAWGDGVLPDPYYENPADAGPFEAARGFEDEGYDVEGELSDEVDWRYDEFDEDEDDDGDDEGRYGNDGFLAEDGEGKKAKEGLADPEAQKADNGDAGSDGAKSDSKSAKVPFWKKLRGFKAGVKKDEARQKKNGAAKQAKQSDQAGKRETIKETIDESGFVEGKYSPLGGLGKGSKKGGKPQGTQSKPLAENTREPASPQGASSDKDSTPFKSWGGKLK